MYILAVPEDIGRRIKRVILDVMGHPVKRHVQQEPKDVMEIVLKPVIQPDLPG